MVILNSKKRKHNKPQKNQPSVMFMFKKIVTTKQASNDKEQPPNTNNVESFSQQSQQSNTSPSAANINSNTTMTSPVPETAVAPEQQPTSSSSSPNKQPSKFTLQQRRAAAIERHRQLQQQGAIPNNVLHKKAFWAKTKAKSARAKKLQKLAQPLNNEEYAELFKKLDIPEDMPQEQVEKHLRYEEELQFKKTHFRLAHSLLDQSLVDASYNELTVTDYANKLIASCDHKPYYGVSPFNCCLEQKFPEATQVFQNCDRKLINRHLEETVKLAQNKSIASKNILRGVNVI